jgi:hypothetical protein
MDVDRDLKTEPDVNGIDSIKGTVKVETQNIVREQWGWYTTSKQKATTFCGTVASRISIVSFVAYSFPHMEVNGSWVGDISYYILASKYFLLEKIL